jgi:hypothetical protein
MTDILHHPAAQTPPILLEVQANLRLARERAADAMRDIGEVTAALSGDAPYRVGHAKQSAKDATSWLRTSEGYVLHALDGLTDYINNLAGLGDEPPRAA